ncbi:MAG: hypothetical protein R3C69_05335 [Geminicoccaceae bacterium]
MRRALADQRASPGRGRTAPGAAHERSRYAGHAARCSARRGLTLLGAIGAALLLGSRRGAVLAAPRPAALHPVLIFGGVAAVDGVLLGLGAKAPFLILAAIQLCA